jgi:fumarate hydratase subunit alpha
VTSKQERFEDAIFDTIKNAVTQLPVDVVTQIKKAYKKEKSAIAKTQLKTILENIELAKRESKPMCQDTGIPVFYVDIGRKFTLDFSLETSIKNAVKKATEEIPLRSNTVHPLSRKNTGDNIGIGMPHIYYEIREEKSKENAPAITYFPKGAGSENMSALKMLLPSEGVAGIERFILETVASAGGKPCPPTIVGVGIGGSADIASALTKKALLRTLGKHNPDKEIAQLESVLLKKINTLGIGPMGLGGDTTALGVNIEYVSCHTASLPVAINLQCWAARKASVTFNQYFEIAEGGDA